MQIPKRRDEKIKIPDNSPVYLTQDGMGKIERDIARLERDLPAAIKEVARTKEFGDFSENEEYKQAKRRMRGMHARIFYLKNRLQRAELIDPSKNKSGVIGLGSTITLECQGKEMIFQIIGTHESDPSQGKISNTSPLGEKLLGCKVGNKVTLELRGKDVIYKVIDIK